MFIKSSKLDVKKIGRVSSMLKRPAQISYEYNHKIEGEDFNFLVSSQLTSSGSEPDLWSNNFSYSLRKKELGRHRDIDFYGSQFPGKFGVSLGDPFKLKGNKSVSFELRCGELELLHDRPVK